MNALRARVYALRRKMARPLAVLRLYRLAYEYCIQYHAALVDRLDPPDAHTFNLRVVSAGFRLPTFMAVHKYLERCLSRGAGPDPDDLLRTLLPWSWRYPTPQID
ncbi:MAG: hypothetical protein J4F43_07565 [Dehalococcoidia bacterium]|nr:hypothetical protein [Dehalococcoidia bacterium]